ncbi:MAG: gamma-glutamyl-gamma-aminobutyrate hydrolase family protein [Microbacteriaceae bacterium]|nr:gamma-glutamyl-gamma-aminobutyrate hydrolase family protein [Microbacteriaceae bacterium]
MTAPVLLVVDATMHRPDTVFTGLLEPLSRKVIEVAEANGWRPRRLLIGDVDEAGIAEAEGAADAIVVMGGDDVDPALYGATRDYPEAGDHYVTLADERSVELIRRAADAGTPLLGICRGLQLVNVAHGGTLVQHLDVSDDHRFTRASGREEEFIRHPVDIVPGTRLAGLFGERLEATESSHHQAVDRPGEGIVVSAHAPDGTPEAIEHVSAPQLAVQWHPEAPSSVPEQLPALLAAMRPAE